MGRLAPSRLRRSIITLFLLAVSPPAWGQPAPPWHWPDGAPLALSSGQTGPGAGPSKILDLERSTRYFWAPSPWGGDPLLVSWTKIPDDHFAQSYGVFLDAFGTPKPPFLLGRDSVTVTLDRDFAQLAPGLVLQVVDRLEPTVRTPPLWGRLFDADSGTLLTEEPFVVGRAETLDGSPIDLHIDVAPCSDGSFAVTWTADIEHPLFARAFGPDLQPRGPAVRFDDEGVYPDTYGPLIECGPGGWAVAWISQPDRLQVGHLSRDGSFRAPEEPLPLELPGADDSPQELSDLVLIGDGQSWIVGFRSRDRNSDALRRDSAAWAIHVGPDRLATGPAFPVGSSTTTDRDISLRVDLALALDGDDLLAVWTCLEGPPPGVGGPNMCARAFTRRDSRFLPLEEPTPLVPGTFIAGRWNRIARTSAGYLVTWLHLVDPNPSRDPHPLWRRLVPPPATDLFPLTETEVTCLASHALDRVPDTPEDLKHCTPAELTDEDTERATWLASLFEGPGALALHRTEGIDSFRLHTTAENGSRLTADVRMIFRQSGELDGLRLTPRPTCPDNAEGEPVPLDCSLPGSNDKLPDLAVMRADGEGSLRALRLRPGHPFYLEADRLPDRTTGTP